MRWWLWFTSTFIWSEEEKPSVSPGWVITLHTYTLIAEEEEIACEISFINRFGIMLVYSEPGPKIIICASSIAFKASGVACDSAGSRETFSIGLWVFGILFSPTVVEPSLCCATKVTLFSVDGITWPLNARTLLVSLIAFSKSPVKRVITVIKRFPKLCPESCEVVSKRN